MSGRRQILGGAAAALAAAALGAGTKAAQATPKASAPWASPDAELIAACDRFAELEHRTRRILDEAPDTHEGDDAADAAIDPIREEQAAILDRVYEMEAKTWDGVRARLRMTVAYMPKCIDDPSDWDDMLAGAVIEDVDRLLGAAAGRLA